MRLKPRRNERDGADNPRPVGPQLYGATLELQKSRGTKTGAEHVKDKQSVKAPAEEVWIQRQVAALPEWTER